MSILALNYADGETMTANAARKALGVSAYSLQRLALTGRLTVRVEPGLTPRYQRAEVEALVAEQAKTAAQ